MVLEDALKMSGVDWEGYCRLAEKLKREYLGDGLKETRMEQLNIDLEESNNENFDTHLDAEDD
jgi:hypothetical protein